jgi:D-beta-D-heptose 7-phosphate kinase/D-beta-D-heptose 1-phosphate adenosyltransferase
VGTVVSLAELLSRRRDARTAGKRVVFTNGCFDLLHRGHVELLARARALGDVLVVGLNSDDSVRRLKGPGRPLVKAADRALVLAALQCVDYVCLFGEDTPAQLIAEVLPDVLVKGEDYPLEAIVGRDTVERTGGRVVTVPLVPGYSTRDLIRLIVERYGPQKA